MILAYLLEILVFFCEIFLYLKLKWSSLGSPLGFSFNENLTTIKIKQEWQIAMPMFCIPAVIKNVFTMLHWSPLRFFPQVPYMPRIMNLKKLYFMHFNKVTQMGVKGC
jgi:hypothetical protein